MTAEPTYLAIRSADEPVTLDEVTQWIESDRKWLASTDDLQGTGHRLEMMGDAAEALIKELRDTEQRLAESDERNSNLFDLGNKHLDTIDRVKAAGAKLQEAVDRIRRVLADGQHDESCGTQYRINPEPCDCWLADLREAIDGGGK